MCTSGRTPRGEVLYVGKAKRLRSRVRSYFATDFAVSPKNQLLQRLIADVETIVVPSEAQSLLLENNLIKEYRPALQRPAEGRQELSLDRGHAGRAVPASAGHPEARTFPGPATSAPTPTWDSCAGRWRSSAASTRCGAVTTISRRSAASDPASTITSARCLAPCVGWQDEPAYRRMVDDVVAVSRGQDPGRAGDGFGKRCWRPAAGRTTSAPGSCGTRSAGWSGWRSPSSVEVIGTGDADVIGYARDGDDAVGVLIRVRDGRGRRPGAPLPRGCRGGSRTPPC